MRVTVGDISMPEDDYKYYKRLLSTPLGHRFLYAFRTYMNKREGYIQSENSNNLAVYAEEIAPWFYTYHKHLFKIRQVISADEERYFIAVAKEEAKLI